jgi:ATP-dependent RNA helicase RhlE
MQALEEFKQGQVPVLVATDIAARGLDIEELPFVINFELPHTAEDYVHRIGRTARAGLPGEAISLVSPEEMKYLEDIERLLKRKLPRAVAPESLAETRPSPRPREPRHERGAPHHRPRPQPEPKAHTQPKPQPTAARTSPHAFDYTKPYEPSPPRSAPSPVAAPAAHRKLHRPTAALLGGGPPKREPHK